LPVFPPVFKKTPGLSAATRFLPERLMRGSTFEPKKQAVLLYAKSACLRLLNGLNIKLFPLLP
jgi:hypothetical protein